MSELSQGLITFYILGVVFAFYLGLGAYRNKDTRIGARFLLASFVWPLAALSAGIRALFYWVPRLWRGAVGDAATDSLPVPQTRDLGGGAPRPARAMTTASAPRVPET